MENMELETNNMETKYALYDSQNNEFVVNEDTNIIVKFNTYLGALKECSLNQTIVKLEG